jgi:uncharacterized membrane protein HdeD (DUF308 family)
MNNSMRSNSFFSFTASPSWFFGWGLVLVAIGALAIAAATLTTLFSVVFIGAFIFAGGAVILFDTFKSWWGKWKEFLIHLAVALLYLYIGFELFSNPVLGSASLTLLLGIFYVLVGMFRIITSFSLRLPRWKWSLFSGIMSLVIGILIMTNLPATSLFVIGLFIGIDLLVCGWTYILLGLTASSSR